MPKRGRRGLKTSSGLVDPINRHLHYLCHVRIGPISGMVEMQKLSFPFQTNTKDTTITQQKKGWEEKKDTLQKGSWCRHSNLSFFATRFGSWVRHVSRKP